MITITVNASKTYDVKIGKGLLCRLGNEVRAVSKAERVCFVSDNNVWTLYGSTVCKQLTQAGFLCTQFIFPAGEESKNGSTYLALLEHLAESQITRNDCLIALGGGVVGDLTGFAAATYLRGVDYIQIPTTLLAAVDSSVGGKTAIDLKAGKNLCGAFYQPKLVLCDTDTLNSLPHGIFRDGCAEVIKYAVLYDAALFAHLEEKGLAFDREGVIARCVELKRNVVAEDEFDRGQRMKLNLGHTIGHGIEAQSNFTVSHGQAVAIGMAAVCRTAAWRGVLNAQVRNSILALLENFGLPVKTEYNADAIYASALSDKKRSGAVVNFIVPYGIGDCRIVQIPTGEMKTFIEEGL